MALNKELIEKGTDIEKLSRLIWLGLGGFLIYLSYHGMILQSIHFERGNSNINLDGTQALIFGILTFLSGLYLIYLFICLYSSKNSQDE